MIQFIQILLSKIQLPHCNPKLQVNYIQHIKHATTTKPNVIPKVKFWEGAVYATLLLP